MALPNERLIDARLTEWGLVRDDDSPLAPATSKNRTILCRAGPKKRVLVKIADGPGNVGVLREGGILELLSRFADDRRSPLVLPKVFAFDRNLGLLAVEWLSPSETLHSYHRRTGKYGRSIARQLGRALAFLHRQSRENPEAFAVRDGFREESDLLECFLRMRPDFYARLSRAGIDFFCEVQADAAAVSGLQAISDYQEEGEQSCLLHGDLKQANVLKVTKSRLQALAFVDWELSFWGDPARDVGSIVADYALSWLAPEHENEAITKETLHQVSRALLVAYRKEREAAFALDEAFQRRVVQWAGAALLFYVYGMTHYEGVFSERARRLTDYAMHMLGAPEKWPARLWGAA